MAPSVYLIDSAGCASKEMRESSKTSSTHADMLPMQMQQNL